MARTSDLSRWLDRIVGGAAASLLPRRQRAIPGAPASIVFVQPAAIGDTLISSGAVAAIAEHFAGAELIMAHGANNAGAVKLLDAPLRSVQIGFDNPVGAVQSLRPLAPDMIIDLTPWPYATALAVRLAGAWSAGFQPPFGRRADLFDLAVPHLDDRHEFANLNALATALGAKASNGMAIRRSPELLPDLRVDDLVLFHVSAGGSRAAAKAWPQPYWAELARALAEDGWRIGFTGAPSDAATIAPILAAADLPEDRAFSLAGKMSLQALAELLARVPLLVSIDTGVLHLSAAVNGRSLGLHGPTRAARWGSLSSRASALDAPHPASGFIKYGWEMHPEAMAIMPTLSVEAVLAAARELLVESSFPVECWPTARLI